MTDLTATSGTGSDVQPGPRLRTRDDLLADVAAAGIPANVLRPLPARWQQGTPGVQR